MATLTKLTVDGSMTEKKIDPIPIATGNITNQSALNSEVIFSLANHGLTANQPIVFTASTGTNLGGNALLPANIKAGTTYYVKEGWTGGSSYFILTGVANNFQLSASPGGANIAWGSGFQGVVSSPGHTFTAYLHATTSTLIQHDSGATTTYTSNTTVSSTATYNITSGKVVVAYIDTSDSSYGKAVVGSTSNVVHPGCSYTNGQTALTISGGANLLWAGFKVSGTGIPAGTTIASTGPFVLSAAATETVSSGSLTFENNITGGVIWGTPVNFSDTTGVSEIGIAMATLPGSSKVVIAWSEGAWDVSNAANKGTSKVGTISDMGISFGAETTFESSGYGLTPEHGWNKCIVSDTTNNRVILAWYGGNHSSRQGLASCGTVSGTTLTWSTPMAFSGSGAFQYESMVYDATADKFVLAWENYESGANAGKHVVGTAHPSTNVVTFGTAVVDAAYSWDAHAMTYSAAAGKIVHIFRKYGIAPTVATGFARVGTISGTTVSWGVESTFPLTSTNDMYDPNIIYHAASQKVMIIYSGSNREIYGVAGTITGTTISLSTRILINDDNASTATADPGLAYDTVANKVVLPTNSVSGKKAEILHLVGTNLTVDLATGNFFEVDLEGSTTNVSAITVSNASATHVSSFVLKITQGSTARQIEFSELSAFKWIGGTTPTLTTTNNAVDILSFTTYDNGTTWHGTVVGQNYS